MEFLEQNMTEIEHMPPSHLMSIFKHPTMADYYGNLTPFIILSMFIGTLIFLLNVLIYHTTVSQLRQRLNQPLRNLSIALCTPYPIISLVALITILVPKSWLICHTIMHLSFTICGILFYRLCIKYMDSVVNFIKVTDGSSVVINTPPCCCCCLCLPTIMPTKVNFKALKYLIFQMPFVQGSVMITLNIIYYREPELYESVSKYFMPFIICSILLGLWGFNIIVRMVNKVHNDYNMMRKMLCLQLILLLCKFQYVIMHSQLDAVNFGGPYPMNHVIYKQTIINVLILAEMILVSLLAQSSYKAPVDIISK